MREKVILYHFMQDVFLCPVVLAAEERKNIVFIYTPGNEGVCCNRKKNGSTGD